MGREKTGYKCSQDATLVFSCKSKQRSGLQLGDKVDTTRMNLEEHLHDHFSHYRYYCPY